jgi:hypothetical protein
VGPGPYTIGVEVAEIIEYAGLTSVAVSEISFGVTNWEHLRGNVAEGDEVVLVGSVPEESGVIRLVAVVIELDDDARKVRAVV